MSRWIRVQTSIFDHEIFAAEPLTEREAWLWLISRAAWKDTVHRIGASIVSVKAGSTFVTVREMQAAWRWASTRRVHRFLELLSSQNMIETSSETGKTCVTICNYAKYQNAEAASETPHDGALKQKRNIKDTNTPDTNTSSLRSEERTPVKPTPRAELLAILDEDHADAVVDHRQRARKPLTVHAARLLAEKFSRCADPNAAADAMVANGWQGFEPEWMENRQRTINRRQDPPLPPQKSAFRLHQEACARELDKIIKRDIRYDERPDNVVDLTAADYRVR